VRGERERGEREREEREEREREERERERRDVRRDGDGDDVRRVFSFSFLSLSFLPSFLSL